MYYRALAPLCLELGQSVTVQNLGKPILLSWMEGCSDYTYNREGNNEDKKTSNLMAGLSFRNIPASLI
jgi:hypothetical protein